MSDEETLNVYDARAQEYADLGESETSGDPHLNAFITACPAGGRVLDLGCGPGKSSNLMARAGLVVDATDGSREMVALAGAHTGVTAWQATFDQIKGEAIYDGIWANFSLLHAPRADFDRHLTDLYRALRPGGAFFIGMKIGQGDARDGIGRHYTYYTVDGLTAHLSQAGFTVTDHVTGRSMGLDKVMADYVLMRAHG
ncbi:MAG: class I SAM-dependent methyltransferase [Sedimentitalea sp.]